MPRVRVFTCHAGACLGRLELATTSAAEAWFLAEEFGWQIQTGPAGVHTCRRHSEEST